MTEEPVLYRRENQVACITINRQSEKNAITAEAVTLLLSSLDRAEADEAVRALLITGAGEKAFCTGARLGDGMAREGQNAFREYACLLRRLATFPKPTVARVKGYCLAGGMGLMLACDIAVASEDSRFGTPEVNVGLWPMMIGALIFRNVPRKKAMEMILLGELLTAGQALGMGLITRTVPPERLDETVGAILETLSAKSPAGIRIGKEAFHEVSSMPLAESLEYLSQKLMAVASTEDAREGITAFIEKRPPRFTGK